MSQLNGNLTSKIVLGCIADDVTGATDLAINLVQGGMRVVQLLGVPTQDDLQQADADAVVIALKSRSIPAEDAIAVSLEALESLRRVGVDRFFFKYCSTFDSTIKGNIGPVAVALMDALSVNQTVFCPAFPRNGRTVYQGHLFVFDRLLNESGMEKHPLNPMTDADLVRFLSSQTEESVGLISWNDISERSVADKLACLRSDGIRLVITDACDDGHLRLLAESIADMRLVTGGSGIGRYLPEVYRATGQIASEMYAPELPQMKGRSAILSGSCSNATNDQVAWMRSRCPSWEIDVESILQNADCAMESVAEWVKTTRDSEPVLIYSTTSPDRVASLQKAFGADAVAKAIEEFVASIAVRLADNFGVTKFILAGGETSGAVVDRLNVRALRIGPEICPGVPWTESIGGRDLALALKSGNFGNRQFFAQALEMLV